MYLSRPLSIIIAIACAVILLASNALNSSSSTRAAFNRARSTHSQRRDLSLNTGGLHTALPPSSLLAFVGVCTATVPERRHALRATWFPSSEAELLRQGQTWFRTADRRCTVRSSTLLSQGREGFQHQGSVCGGAFTGTSRSGCVGRGEACTQRLSCGRCKGELREYGAQGDRPLSATKQLSCL